MATKKDDKDKKERLLEIEYVPLSLLKPHPDNPKAHTAEDVAELVEAIKDYGWTHAIRTTDNYVIVDGHKRRLAAGVLKMDTVPVVRLPLDDTQALEYLMVSKRTQAESTWNELLLAKIVENLQKKGVNIRRLGFSLPELRQMCGDSVLPTVKCPCCGGDIPDRRALKDE